MTNDLEIIETIFYIGSEGAETVKVIIGDETLWASQKSMADLFDTSKQNISKHLKNIFDESELIEDSVVNFLFTTARDGKKYKTKFYNLDAMIAVGYRVNSKKATKFRQWATSVLKEFMVKGFVLDDELLKHGSRFGKDYFDELLERIREIRSSERRVYEKVTDLFATSYDYEPNAEITRNFFKKVQSKLHFAVLGLTPLEIIKNRASSDKVYMGLTTWKNAPNGKILLTDTKVAKNYLSEDEISELNRIVNMYLDYAENQAFRHKAMSMSDWDERLDKFLEFNEYQILKGKGSISRVDVDKFVEEEFVKFRPIQDKEYKSDYNKFCEEYKKLVE